MNIIATLCNILAASWAVLGDMAPYLLFGFAAAGLLSIWISPEWTQRHLGGGMRAVLKALLLGVPLPLCSCGVIPVALGMRRHGASRAAITAFLISTPQTGVDGVAVTYALLGPVFALFRPIAALVSGLLGGALVLACGPRNGAEAAEVPPPCAEECCAGDRSQNFLWRAAHYGFVTLPRDLAVSLLLGIAIAGIMAGLARPNDFHCYLGGGIVSMLLMIAAGAPLYVCATASVPIAAGLLYLGASPGAALAFLIAGPATNAATFLTLWKVLGSRTSLLYLLTVLLSAVLCGLLLDQIAPPLQAWLPQLHYQPHEMHEAGGWLANVSAAVLLAILALSLCIAPRSDHDHAEG
ncbi:MAG: SO_0444 family Cu/Zn efflux transporter [Thermoguttaceae bacterium]